MGIISNLLMNSIKPSITLMVESRANELRAQGLAITSLGAGEPDFDTPKYIKEAAIKAINEGYTKYTPVGGYLELRKAIINKFKRENSLDYNLDEITVSAGAKQAIYNALLATLNPGDEVIIIAPFWVSYPEMVKLAGGVPVIVESNMQDHFSLNIDNIEHAITNKTKWLMINSPNNPSGVVYSFQQLQALSQLLLKYENIYILSDDIYEHLTYDNQQFYNLAMVEPKLKNRILIVNGVSKAYAMTGWRLGYCAGPAELIKTMITVQSQTTSNPCSISQMAASAALNGPQDEIAAHNLIFVSRRNATAKAINQIPGLSCNIPHGAFYLFVDCRGLLQKKTLAGKLICNSIDVAGYLLEQAHVAVVAGGPFGADGFFRISYATSEKNLSESCARIKAACELLV